MPSDLEVEFEAHVLRYCDECKTFGFNPSYLLREIDKKGAAEVVRGLFNAKGPSKGFERLKQDGRLDLAMESAVLEHPHYHKLFTPSQLEKANKWLAEAGYVPRVTADNFFSRIIKRIIGKFF